MKRLFPLSSVFDRERATKSRVGRGSLLSTNTDLTHDTRHLCTRLRTGKLKAMPPGFSGSKLFVNTRNRVEFVFSVKQKIKKKSSVLTTIMANYGWKSSLLLSLGAIKM